MPRDQLAAEVRQRLAARRSFAAPGANTDGTADIVLLTSGSTTTAKSVGHTFEAVQWSAQTSREVLGDEGWRWLLLLPPLSAGGLMVLARSQPEPLVWPGDGPFDAEQVTQWYPGGAEATSMVSTQLARLLDVPAGIAMLQQMRVVLLGGGPLHPGLRERCDHAGINVVATYGATETLGGCVYDGIAWPGVEVSLVADQIHISGPNVSAGYIPGPPLTQPWATGDLGRWQDGRLQVIGRIDDQVPVKGINRHLREYEEQALARPGVLEAVAIAVPDEVDGYRVEVFVEDAEHRLPRLDNGKPDRLELQRRARGHDR